MKWKLVLVIVVIALLWVGWYVYRFEFRDPLLEVHFLNLDKGRSIFIRTPVGKTILIDGGGNAAILRELSGLLPFYDQHIDLVVIRSKSDRAAGGLIDVLDRYRVTRLIAPDGHLTATSTDYDYLTNRITPEKAHVKDILYREDDLSLEVLFPDDGFKYSKASPPQLVLKLEYDDVSMIFFGDATPAIQNFLPKEKVDLIEFSHSGAASRISRKALDAFGPDMQIFYKAGLASRVLLSDGKGMWEK